VLRQKLAIAEDESDQRVLELQSDLTELKDKLQTQDTAIRQAEKEKTILIDELQHQNTRLTEQIQEAHATELKLSAQIQELKDQYHYRNSSLQVGFIFKIQLLSNKYEKEQYFIFYNYNYKAPLYKRLPICLDSIKILEIKNILFVPEYFEYILYKAILKLNKQHFY